MFRWLGNSTLRRFLLGLVLVTYLPVVSATVACQIACAMQMGHHASAHESGHSGAQPGATPPAAHEAAHLAHAGPCNLASVPTMCTADFCLFDHRTAARLESPADTHPASYVGPPPEHKPRT